MLAWHCFHSLHCAISGQLRKGILQPPLIKLELIGKHWPEQTDQSSNDENTFVFDIRRSSAFAVWQICRHFYCKFSHEGKPDILQIRWVLIQTLDLSHDWKPRSDGLTVNNARSCPSCIKVLGKLSVFGGFQPVSKVSHNHTSDIHHFLV